MICRGFLNRLVQNVREVLLSAQRLKRHSKYPDTLDMISHEQGLENEKGV